MVLTILRHFSIFFITFFCCTHFTIGTGNCVPVFRSTDKNPPENSQKNKPKKNIVTLGKYRDYSAAKKRTNRYLSTKQKRRIIRNLSARSAIIIDAKSGKTIFAKKPNSARQPASTIKIITGMIALKSLKKSDRIAVSKKAARQPRSKIYLDHRKKYFASDLINAVLLASANDASVALAEKIAGSEKKFATMMTHRAKLWGARNTVCKTATGLTASGQKSTARDLATLFAHVMKDKEFARRMKKTKARTRDGKLLRNHNKALWQVQGTLGGKTGYTHAARQTYVGQFKRGDSELIIAIMGSEAMWTDIKNLVNYGFNQQLLTKNTEEDPMELQVAGIEF